MNIAHLVYGVDGKDHFTGVEPGHLFRKMVLKLAEQRQDITTYIVVHHQVLGWEMEGDRVEGWKYGVEEWREGEMKH